MFIPMDEDEDVENGALDCRGDRQGGEKLRNPYDRVEPGLNFQKMSLQTYSMLKEVEDGFSTRHNKGSAKIGGFSSRVSQVQARSNHLWSESSGEETSKAIKSFSHAMSFDDEGLDEVEEGQDQIVEEERQEPCESLEKGEINLNNHKYRGHPYREENPKGIMKASKFQNYVRDATMDNESKMSQVTAETFLPQSFWEEELPTKSELIRKWESEMSNVMESKSSEDNPVKMVTFLENCLLSRRHSQSK